MIKRAVCNTVFGDAVIMCDPAVRVAEALEREPLRGHDIIGLAFGKAALAMACGAGHVTRGLVVTPHAGWSQLDPGWSVMRGGHPMPDETSLAAGAEAIRLVDSARADDVVLALISGGASALVEQPRDGVGYDEVRRRVHEVMASGASIHELNRVRTELSAIKGGKLAARSRAPVVTLVISDVIGDDPRVIGSGPTVTSPLRAGDRAEVIAPMSRFGEAITRALVVRNLEARRLDEPIAGDVALVADRLAAEQGLVVAWGEPTVRVPERAGTGGRAQQLALELARRLRGTTRSAFVAGSDGRDGPSPRGAAGAYVDGQTWDAIAAARIDPDDALRRCDAGRALDAVGALVVTGPTGINHADVAIIG
jgi:hydroxypyruvate reductase